MDDINAASHKTNAEYTLHSIANHLVSAQCFRAWVVCIPKYGLFVYILNIRLLTKSVITCKV